MARHKSYRSCFVPTCKNSTINSNKRFICVPLERSRRLAWFTAVGREMPNSKTVFFCCEDHFNLEEDMANYVCYKLWDGGRKIHMKPEVVPHIFDHEPQRKEKPVPQFLQPDTNSVQTPPNSIITPKEPDKTIYVVMNQASVIQGVLIMKNDLPALTLQSLPGENGTHTDEIRSSVDNSTDTYAQEELSRAEKKIAVNGENYGIEMHTVKEERIELDELWKNVGEKAKVNNDDVKIKEETDSSNCVEEQTVSVCDRMIKKESVSNEDKYIEETLERKDVTKTEERNEELNEEQTAVKKRKGRNKEETGALNCFAVPEVVSVLGIPIKQEPGLYDENNFIGTDTETEFVNVNEETGSVIDLEKVKLEIKSEIDDYDADSAESCDGANETSEMEQNVQHSNFVGSDGLIEDLGSCGLVKDENIAKANNKTIRYKCPSCPKTFAYKSFLDRHCPVHATERPYACNICGEAFKRKDCHRMHLLRHSDNAPFACPDCGKGFKTNPRLTRHRLTHTEQVKAFVCELCGKRFREKRGLRRHLEKWHHEGRVEGPPFNCQQCFKSFARRSDFNAHCRYHTGERPFLCKFCGKRFKTKKHCVRHEESHSNAKTYECHDCGQRFWKKGDIIRHIERADCKCVEQS